ncbi:MAG: exosortase/archaeosortase family protein [Candidatus Bathyarchaeota archaeon]
MKKGLSETTRSTLYYVLVFTTIAWGFKLVPSAWLERFTARAMSSLFRVLGLSSGFGVEGGLAYLTLVSGVRYVYVTIIRECTAMHVWGILAALVLPLEKGSWGRKAASLVFGGILVFLMNVSRIFLTVYLTAHDLPPFTWYFTNPTVETYHYPISFLYGVIGVAILIVTISRWFLPELAETLIGIPEGLRSLFIQDEGNQSFT